MKIIFYTLIALIVYFVVKILIRLFNQSSKGSVHSFNRKREEKKFENIQDAHFTEIKNEDSKKND
jgi:large-conductance mechanosensitive channel